MSDETVVVETPVVEVPAVIQQWQRENAHRDNKSDIQFAPDMKEYAKFVDNPDADVRTGNDMPAEETKIEAPAIVAPAKQTDFEARKLFLAAQQAERAATQKLNEAKALAGKYTAMEQAIAKKDYVAWVKAGGQDVSEFYQGLTKQGLEMEKKVDPVAEIKAQQEQTLKTVQELQNKLQTQEERVAVSNKIASDILPVISANPDKYDTILSMHGGNVNAAAIYVFNSAVQAFEQSGQAIPLAVVAERLEEYHTNLVETGIQTALKMKKFQSKYGVKENSNGAVSKTSQPIAKTMTKQISQNDDEIEPVITNKQGVSKSNQFYSSTGDAEIDAILKKHGYTK